MNQTQHDASETDDPEQAFASVVALRLMADRLERKAVAEALARGWSWARIAQALGVSKQAAHKRLSGITPTIKT
jgi:DNA-directed RNA polymerase specialized sigma24 family protein